MALASVGFCSLVVRRISRAYHTICLWVVHSALEASARKGEKHELEKFAANRKCIYSSSFKESSTMGNVFGKDKPLKEVLRENKRMINRAIRELDREKAGLEREEKRLTMEIKKAAKEQQMGSVKIMAKVWKNDRLAFLSTARLTLGCLGLGSHETIRYQVH